MRADRRPNIVIVITDQQRADLSRREGYPLDVTPFVDELAQRGLWFRRAYTTSPVCAPARTSLLTGRYPSAHRVTQNAATHLVVADSDVFSVAREAGYRTALIGKNHTYLGEADVDRFVEFSHGGQRNGDRSPVEAEFDEWLNGLCHRTATEPAPGGVEVQNPYRIVSHATEWIDSLDADRPFVLEISFPEPHNPYQAPEPYYDLFPPESIPPNTVGDEYLALASDELRYLRTIGLAGDPGYVASMPRARSNYLGMLRLIDDQVKRLVNHLEANGRLADTLLLITSDHGDYFGEYGLMRKGVGVSDILMRIPLVAVGFGVTPREHPMSSFASLADIFPTICDYIGAAVPNGVQGRSLRPVLEDSPRVRPDADSAYGEQGIGGERFTIAELEGDTLPGLPTTDDVVGAPSFDELNAVTQAGRMRMVRVGDWKLVADSSGSVALFNVADDPSEIADLAGKAEHRDRVASLLRVLTRWLILTEDELPLPANGYRRLPQPPA